MERELSCSRSAGEWRRSALDKVKVKVCGVGCDQCPSHGIDVMGFTQPLTLALTSYSQLDGVADWLGVEMRRCGMF